MALSSPRRRGSPSDIGVPLRANDGNAVKRGAIPASAGMTGKLLHDFNPAVWIGQVAILDSGQLFVQLKGDGPCLSILAEIINFSGGIIDNGAYRADYRCGTARTDLLECFELLNGYWPDLYFQTQLFCDFLKAFVGDARENGV